MAQQADRIFKKAFRTHFSNHEANFPPSRNLELGDYGTFSDGYFTRLGNIKNKPFNIEFSKTTDDVSNAEEFQSEGEVSINTILKGSVQNGTVAAKAALEISFGTKHALYFSSAEVKYTQIENLFEVGEQLLTLYSKDKWEKRFVLVSRLLQGINAVIIISGSSNSSVKLEASTPAVERLNLADANAKFDIVSSNKVSYKSVSTGLSPIGFGLSRVYNPIFHKPDFNILNRNKNSERFRLMDSDKKIDKNNLVFGDIMVANYDA